MMNLALSMILFGIIVKSVSLGSTDGFGIKIYRILVIKVVNKFAYIVYLIFL